MGQILVFNKFKRISTPETEYKVENYLQVKITNVVCDNRNSKLCSHSKQVQWEPSVEQI